jgi:hypothetical protein
MGQGHPSAVGPASGIESKRRASGLSSMVAGIFRA